MGTKIQANAFFREYHSVIDLNGSTSNDMRSIYHENQILKNGQINDSFPSLKCKNGYSGYDLQKVRQTILEHESIFRNQLQELHRLYGRQQELMNEIKRGERNTNDLKEEKCRLSSFFSPEEAKRKWNNACHISSLHSTASCPSKSGTNSKLFPSFLENKSVPVFPSTQERHFKLPRVENTSENTNHHRITKLSLGDVQTSQLNADASTFNLYTGLTLSSFNLGTKDFFQSSLDGMKGESCPSGLRNGRSGKEHQSGDYAEKRRFDKHSSVEDFFSGKSRASPHSNCPYMGTSVSRRKKKIFGVEISEGNDGPFNGVSNKSSTVDQKIGPHQENLRVVSSWVANSCMKNLELGGTNTNDGNHKVTMADSKDEISSQKRLSYQCTLTDPEKCFTNDTKSARAELLKQNSEHSQKFQPTDFQSNQENPEGGLPWFLKNSQVSGDRSKSRNNSYFMNLDSLQNCSQNFFGKSEIAKGAVPTLKQKKEISAPIVAQEISEANCSVIGGDSAKKVEIDENVQTNQLETKDLILHKGLNNYIADLRHHIDLNLSLDEEDALSAPSLPTAVVKIATTEIDLEAPAVIEPETSVSPEKVNSRKMDVSYEERDKTAAEAIIAISLSAKKNLADDANRLKWFADIISSQCGGTDRSGAPKKKENRFLTVWMTSNS
ncbi:hypothetical protein DH2020_037037 [Rehmannia glutinosa]|uniref:Uncharacterized protein n=1 Tax=Rehmannia glutinosa TaxID=99300 RepID=A0ABR0V530_REHGL